MPLNGSGATEPHVLEQQAESMNKILSRPFARPSSMIVLFSYLKVMKKSAHPKSTGGGGFSYEDEVIAFVLLHMLAGSPLASLTTHDKIARVAELRFQQRPAGWFFDDLVIKFVSESEEWNAGCSIKSTPHISSGGIKKEIVEAAWSHFDEDGPFDEQSDLLFLVQSPAAHEVERDVDELIQWAVDQAEGQLESYIEARRVGSETKRKICDSLRNSEGHDPQRLLKKLRVMSCDLGSTTSSSWKIARHMLEATLYDPTDSECLNLWNALSQIASRLRPTAGSITRDELIAELVGFKLRELPFIEPDAQRLRDVSRARSSGVIDTLGGTLKFDSSVFEEQILETLEEKDVLLVFGESGSGKSAVLKRLTERDGNQDWLYFQADSQGLSPSEIRAQADLVFDLGTVLENVGSPRIVVVVDQIDRLHSNLEVDGLIQLAALCMHSKGKVKLVLGGQRAESERVLTRLRAALPRDTGFGYVEVRYRADELIDQASVEFPQLNDIKWRPELREHLATPGNLNIIVSSLRPGSETEIFSRRDLIELFWDHFIALDESISRGTVVNRVARAQADNLSTRVPTSEAGDASTIDALCKSTPPILQGDERFVSFALDSYGDWARYRVIDSEAGNRNAFLVERARNPVWLRAFRLWSSTHIESEGPAAWLELFNSFDESQGDEWLLRDAMLDGLSLASSTQANLRALLPAFESDEGRLLNRFLTRFLFAGTQPNELFAQAIAEKLGTGLALSRATFRVPNWYLWSPLVGFIRDHHEICFRFAPDASMRILAEWLEAVPTNTDVARPVARKVLLEFARALRRQWADVRSGRQHYPKLCARGAVAAMKFEPESAKRLLLRACGRIGRDPFPDAKHVEGKRYAADTEFGVRIDKPIVGPWPDGPICKPNSFFRSFLLLGGGIASLTLLDPALMKEIALACLIKEPFMDEVRFQPYDHMPEKRLLVYDDFRDFYPVFHDSSFWQVLFSADPDLAADILIELTDFATDRWVELASQNGGPIEAVEVYHQAGSKLYEGGFRTYTWSRDGGHCPHVISSGLMTLEKLLIDKSDEEEDTAEAFDGLVASIVDKARSTAFLGLLCSVGKRRPKLLSGPLGFLHFSENVLSWDFDQSLRNEGHQMIAWNVRGEEAFKKAQDWHGMRHRRHPLQKFAFEYFANGGSHDEAEHARARWTKHVATLAEQSLSEGESAEVVQRLRVLISLYDPASYKFSSVEGGVRIECELPDDLRDQLEAKSDEAEESLAYLTRPIDCRRVLDGERDLTDNECEDWIAYARTAETGDLAVTSEVTEAADLIAGTAAALIIKKPDWLSKHPEAFTWCRDAIVRITTTPPASKWYDSEASASKWQWSHFCAEALPVLLEKDRSSGELRMAVIRVIEDGRWNNLSYLGKSLSKYVATDSPVFLQTINIVIAFAVEHMWRLEEERRSQAAQMQETRDDLVPHTESQFDAVSKQFIANHIADDTRELPIPIVPPAKGDSGWHSDKSRSWPRVDTNRLAYFYFGLQSGCQQDNESTYMAIDDLWMNLLDELVLEIEGNPDDEGSVQLYGNELEIFQQFGSIFSRSADYVRVHRVIASVVSVTPFAEAQIEWFLKGLFIEGLASGCDSRFESNWRALLEEFGYPDSGGQGSTLRHRRRDVRHMLVGNDSSLLRFYWKPEHARFVKENENVFRSYVQDSCQDGRSLVRALDLIMSEAFAPVRVDSCVWIAETLSESSLEDRYLDVRGELATFLEEVGPEVRNARSTRPEAFDAYLQLLVILNKTNTSLAMQLLEDIALSE